MITYSAIAAGNRDDGTIAALACIEGMPSAHDLVILGVFTPETLTRTWGRRRRAADFLDAAVPLLAPYLIEQPS